MSVEKFINELEQRSWLPERVLSKLRATVVNSHRTVSARSLAKFLVEKRHLSRHQAAEVLKASAAGEADVVPADSPAARSAPEPEEGLATADTARIQRAVEANQFKQIDASQMRDDDEDYEGSSIFAPFLTKPTTDDDQREDEEELTLAPVEEDMVESDRLDVPRDEPVGPPIEQLIEPPVEEPLEEIVSLKEPPRRRSSETPSPPAGFDDIDQIPPADEKTRKKLKKKSKRGKKQNRWDSPLMLVGGGGLTLMLLAGGTVWWLMTRESADQQLTAARTAVESGAYSQAIEQYEKFLEGSPRHPEHSSARVQLALVRIRQATEAANYPAALQLAETELKEIEDEEDFDEAHAELAALLPQIALGLAKKAEDAGPAATEADDFAEQANKALALSNNVNYVLKSLRNEAKLAEVRETLERTRRRQQTHRALEDTLAAMREAVAAGDTRTAYTVHAKLLREYPHLASDATLAEAIQKTTAAEQAAIRFVDEVQAAETRERPTPWVAALAIAHRSGGAAAATDGVKDAACVRVDGAVYGLDAASGRLLWRRHVGFGSSGWPIRLDRDVLVIDGVRHELVRLEAATGRLIWRQAIGEPFAQPLVVGGRAFAAAESGRLFVIDLQTGARAGYVQFAQPLSVTPTVDRQQQRLYVAGEQACLYTISLSDLGCQGVRHLGHAEGSIKVPPAYVADKLALLENDGVETSRLRLVALDRGGAVADQLAERRLQGLAATPPLAAGRRLIVVTDRGQIEVYDVAAGKSDDALTVVATRAASGRQPVARHVAAAGRNVWIGDTKLTKYAVLPTGNRLPTEEIENNFTGATFDHPLELFGDTLVHVHRPQGRAGAVVAGTRTAEGRLLWQTHVATPPAGPPVVDESAKAITVADAEGHLFRFDEAAIRSRVQDQALGTRSSPAEFLALSAAVDLGQGRAAVFTRGSDQLLLYNPAQDQRAARWIQLESPLAAPLTPLGDGLVAPLAIGQVFYLNSADGSQWGTPFQPRLAPRTTVNYSRAAVVDHAARRFVITDGREKIYLVAAVDQPQPHLQAVAETDLGPHAIESSVVVLGDVALAIGGDAHVVRFTLPSLEPAGESQLPAPVIWGPFRTDEGALMATADEHLLLVSADGEIAWRVPLEHGDPAGEPLVLEGSVLVAYRNGILERRALADGKPLAATDVEHSLAAGPVRFLNRLVLSAHDGTLLVVDQP